MSRPPDRRQGSPHGRDRRVAGRPRRAPGRARRRLRRRRHRRPRPGRPGVPGLRHGDRVGRLGPGRRPQSPGPEPARERRGLRPRRAGPRRPERPPPPGGRPPRAGGRSAATNDKFPNHVLTGRHAAGFTNTLMTKDVQLYPRAVEEEDRPSPIGAATGALESFAAKEPGADFTRVFPYVEGA
ncbi:NAD-binding protein [Streptomyces sp. NPDC059340]|uniref:NAD-binding protein n=1 Tax=Streptomyces sp. NPDC059340 TaxID=3346806 RepID=UPI003695C9A6